MKWLNLLFIGAVVFAFNACERHSASELNVIQMSNEPPVKTAQADAAPAPAAPADDSKPAAKYY